LDAPHSSRVAENRTRDLNQLGEFIGTVLSSPSFDTRRHCTINVYADRLEIPDLNLSLKYESISDITAVTHEELAENDIGAPPSNHRLILVKYKTDEGQGKLAMSWTGHGVDSIDYCEIMLYRAFAAHKVRSKNNGTPSYGIMGY